MRVLFVHVALPSQFAKLVSYLAERTGNEIAGIGDERLSSAENWPAGVRRVLYTTGAIEDDRLSPGAMLLLHDAQRAEAAARAALELQRTGFEPEVVFTHSGTGEGMLIRQVLPRAAVITYCEFFTRPSGSMARFDGVSTLASLEASDRGVAPTHWQKSQMPSAYQPRITVIHDGVDTAAVAPDPRAEFRVPGSPLTLSRADEVVTYASRSLEPFRGFHTFMRALPEIQRRRPGAQVVIAGKDAATYSPALPDGRTYRQSLLNELAGRLDLERVHFTGALPRPEYLALLRVSAVHAYLTVPYTLSWSFTDALASGCLIVARARRRCKKSSPRARTGFWRTSRRLASWPKESSRHWSGARACSRCAMPHARPRWHGSISRLYARLDTWR